MRNFNRIFGACVVVGVYTMGGTTFASEVGLNITENHFSAENHKIISPKEESDEQMEEKQSEEQSSMDSSQESIHIDDPYYSLGQSITTNLWPWLNNIPCPVNMTNQFLKSSKHYGYALKNSIHDTFVPKFDNIVMDF